MKAEYRRPKDIPTPPGDPITPAKLELGRQLFFDPRLSGSGAISCASCHNPGLGWGDGLPLGRGHMGAQLGRRSPTILNLAWSGPYFWDGRAATLEDQAKGPISSPAEMAMPEHDAVKRVAGIGEYRVAFQKAYPGAEISMDTIARAIATFERTIVSEQAPFDRWIEGDEKAISAEAKQGFVLFNTKARCATCHSGWRFTDDGFHDIGLPSKDIGRGEHVPNVPVLQHAFKTPTLRNIDRRAPYMHDGSVNDLEEAVAFYDDKFVKRPSLSPDIVKLGLTAEERSQIVAFLKTLTSADKPVAIPSLPR